jgi:uncharacterized protein YecT (DUF1311 family)
VVAPPASGGSAERFCKSEADRLAALEAENPTNPPNVYRRRSVAAGVSGTLKRTSDDRQALDFSLLVVNGTNIGELEGKAQRKGATYVFTEPNPAMDRPCELVFREIPNGFSVDERKTCPHGAGAEFSGTYVHEERVTTASFDCRKARSSMERLICADEVLGALDVALAAAYRRQPDARDASGQAAQRAWLGEAERCAKTEVTTARDREAATRCLLESYGSRLRALSNSAAPAASTNLGIELHGRMKSIAKARARKPSLAYPGWLVEQTESAAILRALLGKVTFYELRSYVDRTDPRVDDNYAESSGAPSELRGVTEGFLAVGVSGDVWAAILRPAEERTEDGKCVDLWFHGAGRDTAPPAVFERWRSRFPRAPVFRHSLRDSNL